MNINQKIPERWSVKKLGQLFLKSHKKNIEEKNIPVLTNSAIKGVVPQKEYFDREIISEENLCNYYYVECGDFIYNPRISKTAPAGPIKRNHFTKPGCVSPLYTVFKINSNVSEKFYENYFESNLWAYEAYKVANYGARSDRMNITDKDFFNLKLPFPPLPEQEKIAKILSCWDDGIEKLSALIEKKKIQKKALMQQLLTGKHRLKGFSSPWHEVRSGDICLLMSGNAFASDDFQVTGIPLIRISNIDGKNIILDDDTVYLPNDFLDKYSNFIIQPKDLLLAMSGATTGKMGVNKYSFPMLLNQRVCIIRANEAIQDFINQYLLQYNNKILKMSYGGAQPNIRSIDIKKIKLYIPTDISEQKAIADILSAADEEIDVLNKKLETLKEQKKGLMQKLLTGKIRVKVN